MDRALEQMVAIVLGLGDEGANAAPELPGANSPYAILTHCLGVVSWWGGRTVAGREVERDRDAEFVATGSTAELARRAESVRTQFHADVAGAEMGAPPRVPTAAADATSPLGSTQGGALLHVYEELSQHLGQMELTRDLLVAARG
ncbi:MAG TPA: DUF664 domain-containing protein [Acidimicrobiales bacterium]|nr:DUF664 domain-containing protein [Acidimicrobiales bacterium]